MIKRSELNKIKKHYETFTDDELLTEYHEVLLHHILGNEAEMMYEAGYAMEDVREAEENQKDWDKIFNIIEKMLYVRGLDPWKN